jgi:signal transduction histidine kinase
MEVRREVFLIFKEAINNAARHSGCTQVDVELAGSGGDLSITVADDGRGFDIDMAAASNGLLNMRLRAERIGALFEITSAAGRGTRASIVLSGRGRPAIIRR